MGEKHPELKCYTEEGGVKGMKRMYVHLGEWPTTTQWRENRHDLNITTDCSDVGNKDGLTFSKVREIAKGNRFSESNKSKGERFSELEELGDDFILGNVEITIDIDCNGEYRQEADHYVYVLEMDTTNGTYYYIGESGSLISRFKQHQYTSEPISRMREDVEINDKVLYYIESLDRILRTKEEFYNWVKVREREVFLEVALAHETKKVLGGC